MKVMTCSCSCEHILETIGKKWPMKVIYEIRCNKKIRYNDLQSKLEGISPSILASALRDLESIELIQRKAYNQIPPRVEYSLTKKGKEFCNIITPLMEWASKDEKMNQNCKCVKEQNNSNYIIELKNKTLNKIIEACSVCSCSCVIMYAVTLGTYNTI